MRKILTLICLLFLIFSCNDNGVKKPKKIIEKDKMIAILYDLSLLESVKSQYIRGGIKNKIDNNFIYKKYKIDSIQLAENNKYYAADIEEYKKMFEIVKQRLNAETIKLEGKSIKKETNSSPQSISDTPQVQ